MEDNKQAKTFSFGFFAGVCNTSQEYERFASPCGDRFAGGEKFIIRDMFNDELDFKKVVLEEYRRLVKEYKNFEKETETFEEAVESGSVEDDYLLRLHKLHEFRLYERNNKNSE